MGKPGTFIKRITDILLSLVIIALGLPFLIIAAILIKIDSSGPVFFLQDRVGLNGVIFKVYKLRTMVDKAEIKGPVLTQENDPRVTRIGWFLRRTSFDEFPQFFNVLLGDMSIIGPRPEVPSIVKDYTEFQKQVLKYKPGITGIVQVNGRAALPIDVKLAMDVEYYAKASFWSDLKILLLTPVVILTNRGNVM